MLTRTRALLSAAILLGTASAALAMPPTGANYKPFANAYAKAVTGTEIARPRSVSQPRPDLADRQSFFYRS